MLQCALHLSTQPRPPQPTAESRLRRGGTGLKWFNVPTDYAQQRGAANGTGDTLRQQSKALIAHSGAAVAGARLNACSVSA